MIAYRLRMLSKTKVRIHWLERIEDGPIVLKGMVVDPETKKIKIGQFRARIACQPKATSVDPHEVDGVQHVCVRSDDRRAVSCPECKATENWKTAMAAQSEPEKTTRDVKPEFQPATAGKEEPCPLVS